MQQNNYKLVDDFGNKSCYLSFKNIYCGHPLELPCKAIPMGAHNICLNEELPSIALQSDLECFMWAVTHREGLLIRICLSYILGFSLLRVILHFTTEYLHNSGNLDAVKLVIKSTASILDILCHLVAGITFLSG